MTTPSHGEVLPPGTVEVIENPAFRAALGESFYLAGGTGLALHLGHRLSADLDLFSPETFVEDDLLQRLSAAAPFALTSKAPHTIHGAYGDVKLSFLAYPYRMLFPRAAFATLPIADARDIACMKLTALASRGSRRDFVDYYFACREFGFAELLELFGQKYAGINVSRVHLMKSLMYFADAEKEPMPRMLRPVSWDDVTTYFVRECQRDPDAA